MAASAFALAACGGGAVDADADGDGEVTAEEMLTKRKLMPALVRMLDCGLVHPDSRIIGVVRDMDHGEWLQLVRDGLVGRSLEVLRRLFQPAKSLLNITL